MFKKGVASFLALALMGTSGFGSPPLYAQEAGGVRLSFALSKELGVVESYFLPPSENATHPFVIHIQDAHAHPEAQSRIREIVKEVNPDLVSIEGSSGPLHPEYLELIPGSPEVNQAVVEELAAKGELAGAEQAAWEAYLIAKKRPPVFYGVEAPGLYRENLKTYRALLFKEEEIKKLLAPLRGDLEKEKSRILSPELRRLLREKERGGEVTSYLGFLTREAKKRLAIDFNDSFEQIRFPNLLRVVVIGKLEKGLDPQKAEIEKETLLERLKDRKLDSQLSRLESSENPRVVAEALWRSAARHKTQLSDFPNYLRSLGRAVLQSEIEAEEFFREVERLEKWLVEKLAVGEEEKGLLKRAQDFARLEKLLRLELDRTEYGSIRGRTLASLLPVSKQAKNGKLEAYFNSAQSFYRGAEERDQALLENTLQLARQKGARKVTLVTGGFHSAGLTHAMKARGIGYVVIRPRIAGESERDLYSKVLRDEHAQFSGYFKDPGFTKQEALFLKSLLEIAAPLVGKDSKLDHPEVARRVAEAMNRHPVLSRRLQAKGSSRGGQLMVELRLKTSRVREKKGEPSRRAFTAQTVGDTALLTGSLIYARLRPPTGQSLSQKTPFVFTLGGESSAFRTEPGKAARRALSRSELRSEIVVAGAVGLGAAVGVGLLVFRWLRQRSLAKKEPANAEEALALLINRFLLGNPQMRKEQKRALSDPELGRAVAKYQIKEIQKTVLSPVIQSYIAGFESENAPASVIEREANAVVRKDPSSKVAKTLKIHRIHDMLFVLAGLSGTKTIFLGGPDRDRRLLEERREDLRKTVRQLYVILRYLEILSHYSGEEEGEREKLRRLAISGRSEVRNRGWLYKREKELMLAAFGVPRSIASNVVTGVKNIEVVEVLGDWTKGRLGRIERKYSLLYPHAAGAVWVQQWHTRNGSLSVKSLAEASMLQAFYDHILSLDKVSVRILSIKQGEEGLAPRLIPGEIIGGRKREPTGSDLFVEWFGDVLDGVNGVVKNLEAAVTMGAFVNKDGAVALPETFDVYRQQYSRDVYLHRWLVGPAAREADIQVTEAGIQEIPHNFEELSRVTGKEVSDLKIALLLRPHHYGMLVKLMSLGIKVEDRSFDEMEKKLEEKGYYWNGNLLLLKDGDMMPAFRLFFGPEKERIDALIGAGGPNQAEMGAFLAKVFGGKLRGMPITTTGDRISRLESYGLTDNVPSTISEMNRFLTRKQRKWREHVFSEGELIRAEDGVLYVANIDPKGFPNPWLPSLEGVHFDPETGEVTVHILRITLSGDARVFRVTFSTQVPALRKDLQSADSVVAVRSAYYLARILARFKRFNEAEETLERILPKASSREQVTFIRAVLDYFKALEALVGSGGDDPDKEAIRHLKNAVERIKTLEPSLASFFRMRSPAQIDTLYPFLLRNRAKALAKAVGEQLGWGLKLNEEPIESLRQEWWRIMKELSGTKAQIGVIEEWADMLSDRILDEWNSGKRRTEEPIATLRAEWEKVIQELPPPDRTNTLEYWAESLLETIRDNLLVMRQNGGFLLTLVEEWEEIVKEFIPGLRLSVLEKGKNLFEEAENVGLVLSLNRSEEPLSTIVAKLKGLGEEIPRLRAEIESGPSIIADDEANPGESAGEARSEVRGDLRDGSWIAQSLTTLEARQRAQEFASEWNKTHQINEGALSSVRGAAAEIFLGVYGIPSRTASSLGLSPDLVYGWIMKAAVESAAEPTQPSVVIIRVAVRPEITKDWLPLLKLLSGNRELLVVIEMEQVTPAEVRRFINGLLRYGKRFGVTPSPSSLKGHSVRGKALHPESYRAVVGGGKTVGVLTPYADSLPYMKRVLRITVPARSRVRELVAAAFVTQARLQTGLPENLARVYTPEELAQSGGFKFTSVLEANARLSEYLLTQA